MYKHRESTFSIEDMRDVRYATVCTDCAHVVTDGGMPWDEESRQSCAEEHYPDCAYLARVLGGENASPRTERTRASEYHDCAECAR